MTNLKARAEHYLGGEIRPGEYEEAERSARRKLANIIKHYGPEGHDDEYLAILISEYAGIHRFQAHLEVKQLEREIAESVANNPICQRCGKCGQKEKAATRATSSTTTPILPPPGQKVNTEVLQ